MTLPTDAAFAREQDQQDELAHFRNRFVFDDPDLIYMDGNSLGRLPKETIELTQTLVGEAWGSRLIRSWNEGWMALQGRIGGKIASLIGAQADEVIVADATSVNLFKLVLAGLNHQSPRRKVITDDLNFPSDLYILQGVTKLLGGARLQVVPSQDGVHGPVQNLRSAIDEDTALLALTHTVFKSAYVYNMPALTEMAHRKSALVLWDLSHSVGSVPVHLNEANVDLAVGCTYKYLNGGPGSPAFLYVRRDLQEKLGNPISGWLGHKSAFEFRLDYEPAPGILRFITGTPPVLSLAPIEVGVDLLLKAGIDRLRDKSIRQSEYLIALWKEWLAPLGFSMNSPVDPEQRGSHVSLGHPEGWRISQALIQEMNVLPDFRKPDNIRLGIAPIYTSFLDIHTALRRLRQVVTERIYEKYEEDMFAVT